MDTTSFESVMMAPQSFASDMSSGLEIEELEGLGDVDLLSRGDVMAADSSTDSSDSLINNLDSGMGLGGGSGYLEPKLEPLLEPTSTSLPHPSQAMPTGRAHKFNMGSSSRSSPNPRGMRSACDFCHTKRIKCKRDEGANKCQQCSARGLSCIFSPKEKTGPKPKTSPRSRSTSPVPRGSNMASLKMARQKGNGGHNPNSNGHCYSPMMSPSAGDFSLDGSNGGGGFGLELQLGLGSGLADALSPHQLQHHHGGGGGVRHPHGSSYREMLNSPGSSLGSPGSANGGGGGNGMNNHMSHLSKGGSPMGSAFGLMSPNMSGGGLSGGGGVNGVGGRITEEQMQRERQFLDLYHKTVGQLLVFVEPSVLESTLAERLGTSTTTYPLSTAKHAILTSALAVGALISNDRSAELYHASARAFLKEVSNKPSVQVASVLCILAFYWQYKGEDDRKEAYLQNARICRSLIGGVLPTPLALCLEHLDYEKEASLRPETAPLITARQRSLHVISSLLSAMSTLMDAGNGYPIAMTFSRELLLCADRVQLEVDSQLPNLLCRALYCFILVMLGRKEEAVKVFRVLADILESYPTVVKAMPLSWDATLISATLSFLLGEVDSYKRISKIVEQAQNTSAATQWTCRLPTVDTPVSVYLNHMCLSSSNICSIICMVGRQTRCGTISFFDAAAAVKNGTGSAVAAAGGGSGGINNINTDKASLSNGSGGGGSGSVHSGCSGGGGMMSDNEDCGMHNPTGSGHSSRSGSGAIALERTSSTSSGSSSTNSSNGSTSGGGGGGSSSGMLSSLDMHLQISVPPPPPMGGNRGGGVQSVKQQAQQQTRSLSPKRRKSFDEESRQGCSDDGRGGGYSPKRQVVRGGGVYFNSMNGDGAPTPNPKPKSMLSSSAYSAADDTNHTNNATTNNNSNNKHSTNGSSHDGTSRSGGGGGGGGAYDGQGLTAKSSYADLMSDTYPDNLANQLRTFSLQNIKEVVAREEQMAAERAAAAAVAAVHDCIAANAHTNGGGGGGGVDFQKLKSGSSNSIVSSVEAAAAAASGTTVRPTRTSCDSSTSSTATPERRREDLGGGGGGGGGVGGVQQQQGRPQQHTHTAGSSTSSSSQAQAQHIRSLLHKEPSFRMQLTGQSASGSKDDSALGDQLFSLLDDTDLLTVLDEWDMGDGGLGSVLDNVSGGNDHHHHDMGIMAAAGGGGGGSGGGGGGGGEISAALATAHAKDLQL